MAKWPPYTLNLRRRRRRCRRETEREREQKMRGISGVVKKALGEMEFTAGGGVINWFPGHMAAATRAIRDRLKLADMVIEVRDSRIPLSSANQDLQPHLSSKRRIIALNKKDLANPNIMHVRDRLIIRVHLIKFLPVEFGSIS